MFAFNKYKDKTNDPNAMYYTNHVPLSNRSRSSWEEDSLAGAQPGERRTTPQAEPSRARRGRLSGRILTWRGEDGFSAGDWRIGGELKLFASRRHQQPAIPDVCHCLWRTVNNVHPPRQVLRGPVKPAEQRLPGRSGIQEKIDTLKPQLRWEDNCNMLLQTKHNDAEQC